MPKVKETTTVITRDMPSRVIHATKCDTEESWEEGLVSGRGWLENHEEAARNAIGFGPGQSYKGALLRSDLTEKGLLVGCVWTVPPRR